MVKEGKSMGVANFSLLFIVLIVFFGAISLLMNNINYILLPVFGSALGMLRKRKNVKAITCVVILIFSALAVTYLAPWFTGNFTVIYILFGWFIANILQILLLVVTGVFIVILLRKGMDVKAIIRAVILIFSLAAVIYLALWFIGNVWFLTLVALWFINVNLLPLLLVAIGFFVVNLSLGYRKPQVQKQ